MAVAPSRARARNVRPSSSTSASPPTRAVGVVGTLTGSARTSRTPRSSRWARIPAGPNSLPVLERNLAVFAAAALPPRVISYAVDMFALYVGGFAHRRSSSRRSAAWPTTWSPEAMASAQRGSEDGL